jgi:hypothetical protein
MLEIINVLFFFASATIFSLIVLRERTPIYFFRSFGLIFSISIILHFNLNWILKRPMDLILDSLAFLCLALFFLILDKKNQITLSWGNFKDNIVNKEKWKSWLFIAIVIAVAFISGLSYFEGKLDEPRYNTPDPAIHFLYLSNAAETGFLSMFAPNSLYEASGYNIGFKSHNDAYFPGPAAAYYLLSSIFYKIQNISLFQLFNIVFYAFSCVYLFLISTKHFKKRNTLISLCILVVVLFGSFFDFLFTSFTSQLVGLFMLLFFVDTFYEYYSAKKIAIIVPIIGLAGVVFTYFYWLPIALAFIFLVALPDALKIKKVVGVFFMVASSFLLATGYILLLFKLVKVSDTLVGGGFPFASKFLNEPILIAPFAFIYLYLLLKEKFINKKDTLLANFSLAVIIYSATLTIAYIFDMASGYVFMKVYYLTVPVIWIMGLLFFFEKVSFESISRIMQKIKKNDFRFFDYFSYKLFYYAILYAAFIFAVTSIKGISFRILPLEKANANLIIRRDKEPNLTSDQSKLLSEIKEKYSYALQDNRIVMLTGYFESLWVFSYSGIWPRTFSLIPGDNKISDKLSYMSPNSDIDYYQWLSNDKAHYLIYLNNKFAKDWVKKSIFNFSDYESIASVGENQLLHLKKDAEVRFIIKNNYQDKNKKDIVKLPYLGEFIAQGVNFSGLSFYLNIPKNKDVVNDYTFEIRENNCDTGGAVIARRIITKDSLREQKNNRSFNIFFDSIISESTNKKYCYTLYSKDDPGVVNLVKIAGTSNVLLEGIYTYINK